MNLTIEEKLKLNQSPICFFKEGIFLKVLNESFYIVQQHFELNLKPQVKLIKKINQKIIVGGFPIDSIMTRFPDAKPTLFGYQQLDDYDLSGYDEWFAHCCARYELKNTTATDSAVVKAESKSTNYLTTDSQQTTLMQSHPQTPSRILTEQQLAFLQLWQPNLYPSMIDTAFIKELKDYFCCR